MRYMEQITYRVDITGRVQGVGFRPFIYQLAHKLFLNGTISNGSSGVEIFINATTSELNTFIESVKSDAPPLSKIDKIDFKELSFKSFDNFTIIESLYNGKKTTLIPPDISICKACESELFDKSNRRYLHPFITCTDCGVRYSIIKTLPYDRENTSMSSFEMCKVCESEYNNPNDRRYHAQPIGCHDCGPKLSMDIDRVVEYLRDGKILAVKGVGGYHLVCDGTDDKAVKRLRERKRRLSKPFAVMVKDIKVAKELAYINLYEERLLTSKERPIVLLKSKQALANSVTPNISKIGLFLPYTPLHLFLLHKLNKPLVATSANVTDEPIYTNLESLKKLEGVYDYVLDHNREIVNGCDDSVVMVVNEQTIMIRRARGYAPSSIKLPFKLDKNILALGANQKSTIAIGFDNEVILSPHIGDLDTIESVEYFHKNIESLKRVYDFKPNLVVCDKHPNYESTKYAKQNYTIVKEVQHHYAHILAVMAEKRIEGRVLGVAFDGTGFGDDSNLWGGEFLVCDYKDYKRVAHLREFKLLGGAKAIKEPKRVALSLLFELYGEEVLSMENPTTKAFKKDELKTQFIMWQKGLNAPFSSSCGRLFDAISSLTGVCQVMSFEGESGMLLEELYDDSIVDSYPFSFKDKKIDILPMIEEILKDSTDIAVSKFFNTLVEIIKVVKNDYDLPLVLSGGVFQNRVLLELIFKEFPEVIVPNEIPPNDGGISLGQIATQQLV